MNPFVIDIQKDEGKFFEKFRYPAGEWQVRLTQLGISGLSTSASSAIVARPTDGEVMITALLVDAVSQILDRPTLILPYLPYSRADRSFVDGDCRGLRSYLLLYYVLPLSKVLTLDIHSTKVSDRLDGFVQSASALPFIEQALSRTPGKVAILLPDEGASRYDLSQLSQVKVLQCTKKRDPITGRLLEFIVPPVEEFAGIDSILIIDDICDAGGTFIGIASKLKEYNLKKYLYVTHGIFSKGTSVLFDHFDGVFTTDSFKSTYEDPRLVVFPCEWYLLETISPKELVWVPKADR